MIILWSMIADKRVIITSQNNLKPYLVLLWQYHHLLYFFAWKDTLVRYKQTVLGIGWALIRPLLTAGILFLVFNRIAGLRSGDIPYFLIVLSGAVIWQYVNSSVSEASNSLINNSGLITKIYFPRILLPLSVLLVNLIDLIIALFFLLICTVLFSYPIDYHIIFLPILIGWLVLISFGIGLLFAGYNVKYRDIKYILPFFLQIWLYISPVGFSISSIPSSWMLFYYINPMAGLIDFGRSVLIGTPVSSYVGIIVSITVSFVIAGIGLAKFISVEKSIADTI